MHPTIVAIACFIAIAVCLQFFGFLVSRTVNYMWPQAGLLTFLALFIGAMFCAWPLAVRLTERLVPSTRS